MKPFPIRLRLTLWYFSILAVSLLTFAFFTFATLKGVMHRTVDDRLRAHMTAVEQIIGETENSNPAMLKHDLDEDVELAPDLTLLEIWDSEDHVVYRSAAMNRMQVPDRKPLDMDRPTTQHYPHHWLRTLAAYAPTPHGVYVVVVAIPVRDLVEANREVENTLWIAIPLLLLLSVAGGYWIAGRALSPILSMVAAADAIHPGDLSTRLEVPRANDELRRLALTLNGMLERLQAGFERITRFTADASHELRTPIALLRTRTEILLRRPRTVEEYRSALEANLDELERTSALLEELMLLARADAGAETLHFADVDLTELVRSTAAAARPLADAKNLTWSVELPFSRVHAHGDETALRRLLLVLIDNAVKYTPSHGSVRIALETSDEAATLEVSDTGIGIAENVLPKIFDRFYRADQARERSAGGAGLGLSIGQWIAHRHEGTITVNSALACGSKFSVRLPASKQLKD